MARPQRQDAPKALAADELDEQDVVDLPPREAMSLISTDALGGGDNVAIPINEATAVNYQANSSIAFADADQYVNIDQIQDDQSPTSDQSPDSDDRGHGWGRGRRR
jgi:hypothetical protein